MMQRIKQYYQAWKSKDLSALKELLDPNIYGVRTFTEEVYYTNEEVYNALHSSKIESFNIDSVREEKQSIKATLTINGTSVLSKFTFLDGKISKVYETIPTPLLRVKCICSYDGSDYYGYQKQPNTRTIQETIESAICDTFSLEEITIHASGRTDKGVHANHQVFHFDGDIVIPVKKIPKMLNRYLPESIHILDAQVVDETFHSRYDVIEKEYVYKIYTSAYSPIKRNYEWFVEDLDIKLFTSSLKEVIGTHDFTSFTKTNASSNIRTIYNVNIESKEDMILVTIRGNGFLRYMVRNIIGAAVLISQGRLQKSMHVLLQEKDVNLIKEKAPASGLYLNNVIY